MIVWLRERKGELGNGVGRCEGVWKGVEVE
jgi:hypothetical protein